MPRPLLANAEEGPLKNRHGHHDLRVSWPRLAGWLVVCLAVAFALARIALRALAAGALR